MAPLAKERMEASVVGEIATVAVSLDMIYDNTRISAEAEQKQGRR